MARKTGDPCIAIPLLVLISCTIGCAQEDDKRSDGGVSASDEGSRSDGGSNATIDSAKLGESCNAGCSPGDVCAVFVADSCPLEYCLFDATADLLNVDPYCTSVCQQGDCPSGYSCEEVFSASSGVDRACVAEPSVCGDGAIQRGEVCDDGNTDEGDLCSADCTTVTKLAEVASLTMDIRFVTMTQGDEQPATITQKIEQPVSQSGTDCGQARISEPPQNGRETWEIVLCGDGQRVVVTTWLPVETYTGTLLTTATLTADENPECEHTFIGSDQKGLSPSITTQTKLNDSVVTGSFEGPMLWFPNNETCPGYDGASIDATFRRSL